MEDRAPGIVGEISFAFYLIHLTVVLVLMHRLGGYSPWLTFGASLAISLALSFALFHFVETPARRRIREAFR